MRLLRHHALGKQSRLGQDFETIVLNYLHRVVTNSDLIYSREKKLSFDKGIPIYVLSSIKPLQIALSTYGGGGWRIHFRLTHQQNPICVLHFTKCYITDIGPWSFLGYTTLYCVF